MWLLLLIPVLVAVWLRKRVRRMSVLSRSGIPGPKPHLIFGNLFDGMGGLSKIERQNTLIKKYGKIVGYYTGARPNVLVADPDLAKSIQIKDFNNFTDRSIYLKYQHPDCKTGHSIVRSSGQQWKQMRSILSPTFSAAKLKATTPLVYESVDSLLEIIDRYSENGQEFDTYDLYQKLTAEAIIKTSFGVRADLQNDPNNEFLRAAKRYFEQKVNKVVLFLINCFPELNGVINWTQSLIDRIAMRIGLTPITDLWNLSRQVIQIRKQNPRSKRRDSLQVMLDTEIPTEDLTSMSDDRLTASYDRNTNLVRIASITDLKSKMKGISLSEEEVRANSIVFFGAGYETSSSGLAYVTHFLVNFPEVQERVRKEVQELYEREGKLDFNTVIELQYMEWVINEALRIYPPLISGSTRECLADYKYKDITIPKGAVVVMTTYYLHHDPDYWTDPEKFDPMRFSPERRYETNTSSWQPFGDGPRNCIGMRLAYLVMKLTLAKLLLTYRLEKGPNTEIGELTTKCKLISMTPRNGVFVKTVRLQSNEPAY